jgi:hypothetical protein
MRPIIVSTYLAVVAGQQPERHAEHYGQRHDSEGAEQRRASAVKQPCQQVAPDLVAAEQMRGRRCASELARSCSVGEYGEITFAKMQQKIIAASTASEIIMGS